jgi:hypothetical protein
MNILVYGNCQANQLITGLKYVLLEQANLLSIDINNPKANEQLASLASQSGAGAADIILTNHNTTELKKHFNHNKIIEVPSIHFGGFHPDVVYYASQSTPNKPLFFMNNPTVSALALWCCLNDIPLDKCLSLYNEEVFEGLGYMDYFDVACEAILQSYKLHDINTQFIEKHLSSRNVFMFGPLHPKFEVTLDLCYGICEKLNVKPSMSYNNINNMLPDPLQGEYAWGCFPPIAERLGVSGSWMIRHYNQAFPTIKHYLTNFYQFMQQTDKKSLQFIERDKHKFEQFHKIDSVLARHI